MSPKGCHVVCHAAHFYALIDGEAIVGKCRCWAADTSSEGNCSVGSVIITLVGSVIITLVGSIITPVSSIIITLSELGPKKNTLKLFHHMLRN